MLKTAQPDRSGLERRRTSRLANVMLTDEERVIFQHWYVCLRNVLNKELRRDNVKFFIYKPANSDCVLPKDEVRALLIYIFLEDWKCDLGFNDIDIDVHMRDLR